MVPEPVCTVLEKRNSFTPTRIRYPDRGIRSYLVYCLSFPAFNVNSKEPKNYERDKDVFTAVLAFLPLF